MFGKPDRRKYFFANSRLAYAKRSFSQAHVDPSFRSLDRDYEASRGGRPSGPGLASPGRRQGCNVNLIFVRRCGTWVTSPLQNLRETLAESTFVRRLRDNEQAICYVQGLAWPSAEAVSCGCGCLWLRLWRWPPIPNATLV